MPLFTNAPIHIRRTSNYRAGSWVFRAPESKEAELRVGESFTKEVGSIDLQAGKIYDNYSIDYHCDEATLCIKGRRKEGPPYSSISMILYTIRAHFDGERKEAVVVPKKDARYVEAMSGGGYAQGQRLYDNIIIKASCAYARIIAIQRDSSRAKLCVGDRLYIASKEGVTGIRLDQDNFDETMRKYSLSPALEAWEQI